MNDISAGENISEIVQTVLDDPDIGKSVIRSVEQAFIMKYPSLYCLMYKPIRKKPLTFKSTRVAQKHRPWQVQILDDAHPNKAVEKARQLGLSELAISEFIWFLDTHRNTKAMYTFPRDNQMKDFSNTRVTPVFSDSPYLNALLSKEANNASLKKIGDSYLFMRSAWGSALGEGTDLDLLGFDEYDRMKDNVELAFQEGLSASRYGWLRRWSTPSIPGRGINHLYDTSDQHRYVWKCEHCGEKQFLTLEDNIIQIKANGVNNVTQEIEEGTFIVGCKKCKKEINRWGEGKWIPFNSMRKDVRGYHISQLDAVWITADNIMRKQFSFPSKQIFYNYVAGQPFASSGMIIVDEDIRASIRLTGEIPARTNNYYLIAVGIDWGAMNWMTITGINKNGGTDLLAIYWAQDNPTIPLEPVLYFTSTLMAYNPNIIIADAGYGADRNTYLFTKFPNAMYSCQFTTVKDARARVKFIDQWNENSREVTVDKTTKMQRTLHQVKNRLIGMFEWNEKIAMLTKHLKNVRIMDEENEGLVYQTATRVGPDHLACALCYSIIGIDKLTAYGTNRNQSFGFDFI